jgi:hypothetical protein
LHKELCSLPFSGCIALPSTAGREVAGRYEEDRGTMVLFRLSTSKAMMRRNGAGLTPVSCTQTSAGCTQTSAPARSSSGCVPGFSRSFLDGGSGTRVAVRECVPPRACSRSTGSRSVRAADVAQADAARARSGPHDRECAVGGRGGREVIVEAPAAGAVPGRARALRARCPTVRGARRRWGQARWSRRHPPERSGRAGWGPIWACATCACLTPKGPHSTSGPARPGPAQRWARAGRRLADRVPAPDTNSGRTRCPM